MGTSCHTRRGPSDFQARPSRGWLSWCPNARRVCGWPTLRRGVDAGLTGFVRFALGATTSSNTFESRLLGQVMIPQRHIAVLEPSEAEERFSTTIRSAMPDAGAEAVERVLGLWETLPRDTKKGKRWQFRGLRGPIESALVSLAEKPHDAGRARALTDAIVAALDRLTAIAPFARRASAGDLCHSTGFRFFWVKTRRSRRVSPPPLPPAFLQGSRLCFIASAST